MCSWDTLGQGELKYRPKLIRFSHRKALLFSKKDHSLAKIPILGNLTHMSGTMRKLTSCRFQKCGTYRGFQFLNGGQKLWREPSLPPRVIRIWKALEYQPNFKTFRKPLYIDANNKFDGNSPRECGSSGARKVLMLNC